jgi:2-(1,2-epoxy-1,2-dihydrophenyl)acetyl-CoA isomerase
MTAPSPQSAPAEGSVLVTRADGVVRIVLSNPGRKNALSNQMWAALHAFVEDAPRHPGDRVVVIEGADGDFCAGVDLAGASTATHPTQLERLEWMNAVVLGVHRLPVPVIAKVDGVAFGIGMNLALACDLIVASDRARFCEVFIRRALSVDGGGTWLLPRLVGPALAKQLCFLGEEVDAVRAQRIGLVNQVTPAGELEAAAADIAARLARAPRLAIRQTKALLDQAWDHSLESALLAEARAQTVNIAGPDFAAAVQRFRGQPQPPAAPQPVIGPAAVTKAEQEVTA